MERLDVDRAPARAFGWADRLEPGAGTPHRHNRHQLLYAAAGSLTLHIADSTWLLPPQRGAIIAADTEHRVDVPRGAHLATSYLGPELLSWSPPACAVFSAPPLAREMLRAAPRFGPEQESDTSRAFFAALALLARDWVAQPGPLRLPRAHSPGLARALRWTRAHLGEPIRAPQAARVAGLSARSLSRQMRAETGLSWQEYLRLVRVLRAMELLAEPDHSVTEVVFAVGYQSLPTFSRVFASIAGESPSAWRRGLDA